MCLCYAGILIEGVSVIMCLCYSGILIEGIGGVLSGMWGSGTGTSSFSENVGAIGITKASFKLVLKYYVYRRPAYQISTEPNPNVLANLTWCAVKGCVTKILYMGPR